MNRAFLSKLYDGVIIGVFVALSVIMIFPFYNALLISLTPYEEYVKQPIMLWPVKPNLRAYEYLFSDPLMLSGLGVSVFNVIFGTLISLLITITTAYPLSRKSLPGRGGILVFVIITMYFSGGLVPWYLVVQSLGFKNSLLVMTVPGMLGTFNMILMKNYFQSLPPSLEESARIDGASDPVLLFKIVLPISKPILATIALFYAVERWNDWWNAMLFITDPQKWPLPYLLRKVAIEATLDLGSAAANAARDNYSHVFPLTIQMAIVMVTAVPILLVYPFLQKHFARGIMLGAIKA